MRGAERAQRRARLAGNETFRSRDEASFSFVGGLRERESRLLGDLGEHERPEVLLGRLEGFLRFRDASQRLDAVDRAALAPGDLERRGVLLEEDEEALRDGVVARGERLVAAVRAQRM